MLLPRVTLEKVVGYVTGIKASVGGHVAIVNHLLLVKIAGIRGISRPLTARPPLPWVGEGAGTLLLPLSSGWERGPGEAHP